MGLFTNIFEKVWGNREDELVKAMQKTNNGGNVDDIDTIVDDYVYLIKKTYKGSGISHIELTPDPYVIFIDGEKYNFGMLILHNDQKGTGCKVEIETLMMPFLRAETERRLNDRFLSVKKGL